MERDYEEEVCTFREVNGVTNTLKQQIIVAIDHTYLDALRNVQGSISDILTFLFDTYGRVLTLETLAKEHNSSVPLNIMHLQCYDCIS
jgi:hypothetical protein